MSVKSTLPRSEVGSQNPYPDPPRQAGEGKPVEAPVEVELAKRRSRTARRRRLTIYGLRVLFAVVWLGSWELTTRLNWVDPFFVGQPSGVVHVFFVVFFNAFQGVREVDRNLVANARILGADNRRLTTEIIIPSALSWILASLHISFGLAIVGAVVGELFGATAGLGQLIYNAGHTCDVNGVFAGMFLLAVLALIAEGLISALENRLIKWRPSRVSGEIPI